MQRPKKNSAPLSGFMKVPIIRDYMFRISKPCKRITAFFVISRLILFKIKK